MFLSILKKAAPVPNLLNFDSYLFVGPHPDDIEVGCGGTVARLTSLGKKVTFLIATNGCAGSLDKSLSEQQIVEIRRKESLASAELLGVDNVIFLPYNDGDDYDASAMKKDVTETILKIRPQVVFCCDHTVRSECHPDHLNVGKIVTDAVFLSEFEKLTARMGLCGTAENIVLAYYYTDRPNSYVGVKKTCKKHLEAIALHKSQFSEKDLASYKSYFSLRERRFGLRSGKCRAEGFRVLAPVHRHCFPESSEF